MNINLKLFLVLLVTFSFLFPQKTYTFTEEEVQSLYASIQELEQSDSLNQKNIELYITELEQKDGNNSKIINNLNEQIQLYIQQTEIDSGIIENYKEQLAIQEDMIKTIKPAWHENKYLWFSMGIASMIVPIWAVGQIK